MRPGAGQARHVERRLERRAGAWFARLLLATSIGACSLLAGCSRGPSASTGARRASLQALGPASIVILPGERQPPYCLAFTAAEQGTVRQLTMAPANESIPCPAGEPLGGTEYRIPPGEGKVRVYVIFSDRKLDATPIGAQIRELGKGGSLTAMDLRAPGQVLLETLEFEPQ